MVCPDSISTPSAPRHSGRTLGKYMKSFSAVCVSVILATSWLEGQEGWKTVDEGSFRITIPQDWKKQEVHPIDTHAGAYAADTADLEFCEDLLYTREEANAAVLQELRKKEQHPELLTAGEEVWHVDWRAGDFFNLGKADSEIYGERRFTNVAMLKVPYEGRRGNFTIHIFYKSEADLPTVRWVLRSIEWKTSIDRSPTSP